MHDCTRYDNIPSQLNGFDNEMSSADKTYKRFDNEMTSSGT